MVILYSFYYYNKDGESGHGYIEDEVSTSSAEYNLVIDPERTDLTWYEKLIINRAKKKQEKRQKQESGS